MAVTLAMTRSRSLLPWIVAFKAVKTILLLALAVVLLLAIERNPVRLVWQIADAVNVPTNSRVFEAALAFAFRATPRKDLGLAIGALAYAVVIGIEGVGLYLRRRWARWFTIGVTSSFIPWEIYEIIQSATAARMVLLVLNIALVIYLCLRDEEFK
jgi:uncharacterized membrane protein (DUF2068 family)